MTYNPRPIAPFKIDILTAGNPASYTAGQKIPCTAASTPNTSATISSGQIILPAGSHWRIEYSPVFGSTDNSTAYVAYEIGLYDTVAGVYRGQSLHATSDGAIYNPNRAGRCVATALILNSEISTSMTLEARLVSQTSMTVAGNTAYGTPTFRIMELPA